MGTNDRTCIWRIRGEQNFAVGDAVQVDGASGVVDRIGPTSATLRAAEGKVVVPNGVLAHSVVRPGAAQGADPGTESHGQPPSR